MGNGQGFKNRMAASGFFDRDDNDVQATVYGRKLSSPMSVLWTMVIFLILVGFAGAILFRQAHNAFVANPGLNGLIIGVLLIGILLSFNHVISLRPEVRWFNSFRAAGGAEKAGREPVMLAPMR
eukprot:gene63250-86519_t